MDFLKSLDFLDSFEFDLDFFKELISDFDLMALLPDMADVMSWIITGVGYAMVFGPLLLAFMGLWYLILPPREANHFLGYRFFWGMGSVKSWKFTQRFAGLVWAILGIVLAVEARELRADLMAMDTLDLMYRAIDLILHQIFCVVVASLVVNVIIFLLFNFKGEWRRLWLWVGGQISSNVKTGIDSLKNKNPKEPKRRERRTNPATQSQEDPMQDTKAEPIPEGMSESQTNSNPEQL